MAPAGAPTNVSSRWSDGWRSDSGNCGVAAGGTLTREGYQELVKPSERDPVRRFASVSPDLYDAIVNRCVEANKMCMSTMMAIDAQGGLGKPGTVNTASLDDATRSRLGLDDQPVRSYVGALCSPGNPLGLPLPATEPTRQAI